MAVRYNSLRQDQLGFEILIIQRIPIALRLFLTVLLTTIVIMTVSLGVLHWNMQKNFTRYVTDVEMQKLDHLINNLSGVYRVHQDWGNAIQAQMLQMEGQAAPDDYDRLSRWWLRRQYDIAVQQNYFKEQRLANIAPKPIDQGQNTQVLNEADLAFIERNLPSAYAPFEGLRFPLSSNQNYLRTDRSNQTQDNSGKKQYFQMHDRLGFSSRLSLYDADYHFIVGEPTTDQVMSFRPIMINQQVVGYLGLKQVLEQDDASSINFFSSQKRYLLLVYAITFLASLIAALLLATNFKKPIHRLLQGTRELTHGNYSHQVTVNRNDELGDLGNELNELAHILDQHERSRRQWVADTSHELKTPLAVLQAQIEAMQDGIRKPTTEHFAAMLAQVTSLKKLTQDLAALAQADAQQLQMHVTEFNPWEVVQNELMNFQPKFDQAQLQVSAAGENASVQLDLDRFKQVLANLLSNSIRYTELGGQIHVHSEQNEQSWTLYVDDSPYGLSDEQLQNLGRRFYRVDDSRTRATGGTGLGLALSIKITEALGGQLSFAHSPLGGLRCILTFPKSIKS